ncbi:hypothetical protein [Bacillus swezeyi]|uniref:hypothetical protein n=1 Tax=Bacillus swezeyi TaxID=1925020 RepID=UPI0027DAF634|nr:hypothetical protein [Bacillus swezeyi]
MKKFIVTVISLIMILGLIVIEPSLINAKEKQEGEQLKPIEKLNKELKKKGKKEITEKKYFELANKALEEARIKVNKQLETGKTEISVEENIGEEDLYGSVILETQELNSISTKDFTTQANKKKNYSHRITMKGFAYQFTMRTFGTFTYGKNKKGNAVVKGYSYQCDAQTGWPYSASDSVKAYKIDPSYIKVVSKGTFTALFQAVKYHGYIDIGLYGSGTYRVLRAKFDY